MQNKNKGSKNSRKGTKGSTGGHIHRGGSCKKRKLGNSVSTSCFTWCVGPTNNMVSKKNALKQEIKQYCVDYNC
jgi:hypothetical protein